MTIRARNLAALAMAAALTAPTAARAAAMVGQPAPDFTLVDSNGATHSLADLKGKMVVLEWVNFECPFVGKHYGSGNMQKLQKAYTGKGVVWLQVNSSAAGKEGAYPAERVGPMNKERGAASSAYLLDTDGTVGNCGVQRSLDQAFGLDQEAIKAAKQWRFRPGMRRGEPVKVLVTIEMSFTLR